MSACVTANSCASSTEVRLTFVPETDAERRVRARGLRAEARAWRRAARALDKSGPLVRPLAALYADWLAFRHWQPMRARFFAHWPPRADGLVCMLCNHAVLLCLFLALECEDEARALGRGGQ